jgi:hypothetical protein
MTYKAHWKSLLIKAQECIKGAFKRNRYNPQIACSKKRNKKRWRKCPREKKEAH